MYFYLRVKVIPAVIIIQLFSTKFVLNQLDSFASLVRKHYQHEFTRNTIRNRDHWKLKMCVQIVKHSSFFNQEKNHSLHSIINVRVIQFYYYKEIFGVNVTLHLNKIVD
jgi:hypothetical protein